MIVVVVHKLGSPTSVKMLADASGKWNFNLIFSSVNQALSTAISPSPTLHSDSHRPFTSITMLKRYAKLCLRILFSSMAPANPGDSDAAGSLELSEPLDWHGQQQLDAPSNP